MVLKNVGGKQPQTMSMIVGGAKPRIVKLVPSVAEVERFKTGPLWRIELVSPVWPG